VKKKICTKVFIDVFWGNKSSDGTGKILSGEPLTSRPLPQIRAVVSVGYNRAKNASPNSEQRSNKHF